MLRHVTDSLNLQKFDPAIDFVPAREELEELTQLAKTDPFSALAKMLMLRAIMMSRVNDTYAHLIGSALLVNHIGLERFCLSLFLVDMVAQSEDVEWRTCRAI